MKAHCKIVGTTKTLDLSFDLEDVSKIPTGLEGIILVENVRTGKKEIRKIRVELGETDGKDINLKEPRAINHKYKVTFSLTGYKTLKGGYASSRTKKLTEVHARFLKEKHYKDAVL